MRNILALSTLILLITSCHHAEKHPAAAAAAGPLHLHLNPSDSSTYRYTTSSQTIITLQDGKRPFITQKTGKFDINYFITKDTNDILLEASFNDIDYKEKTSDDGKEINVASIAGPIREILKKMRTDTFYVHVNPKNAAYSYGGVEEVVTPLIDPFYPEADRSQAKQYWGHWASQELAMKNIDPLFWVTPDSVRQIGGHWSDTTTNEDEINFKINKHFTFDSVNAGMAVIHAHGDISNEKGGTWLEGKAVKGTLTGTEDGRFLIDTATGMPGKIEESVTAEGVVEADGRKITLKIVKTITIQGGKKVP